MNIRFAIIIPLISLFCSSLALSQDCQECKTRRIILYDNEVNVPRPTTVDSIYRYWDYFFIAGGVKNYVMSIDPTSGCLTKLDGAFFTVPDTVTSNISFGLEHANTPPAGSSAGFTDYLLYGVVNGQSFTLKLETAKTRELVKSGVISLPKGFDPIQIGRTVAAFVGPIYTTIMDFEKRKRDQGEPYAIQPKITLIPGKTQIKVNEKINIDVLFKDCDGAPMKQRHITFTADGGVLKSAEVTTDDQGHGTLEFTAGPNPVLANVTSVYPFDKPTGYQDAAEVEPASIQIDKPKDTWYVKAKYQISNTYTNNKKGEREIGSGSTTDWTDILYSAWVKNVNPLANRFTCDPTSILIKIHASSGEYSYSSWHWENEAGYIDDKSNSTANAVVVPAPAVKLNLSIAPATYSFSVSNVTASQNGTGRSVRKTQIKGEPMQVTTGETKENPETTLSLSVHDVAKDTTYTTTDISEAGGIKTVKITTVIQTYSWKDNTCKLVYRQTFTEDTKIESPVQDYSRWDQTFTASFYLSYTGDPPTEVEAEEQTVPTAIALNQNYPNPFNPTTSISYVLPSSTHTLLTIIDVLGRKVATLADGVATAGIHVLSWNATGLPSGVYFLQMRAGDFIQTRKLLLAK